MSDLDTLADDILRCVGCGKEAVDGVKPCDCPTGLGYRRSDPARSCVRLITPQAKASADEVRRDLAYLEQAEAHADEGPLGEVAARSILKLALKYVRALATKADAS